MSQTAPLLQLPLFPLQTVLFPDGPLPLQIFEVRYLDMIAKRHKAGEPFGVVCLSEGSEVLRPAAAPSGAGFAAERFMPVGTLARIAELTRPQPGLMRIECVGTRRFRIVKSEQQRFGLWVADVELLDDDTAVPVPEDLAYTRRSLQHVLQSLEQTATDAGSPIDELPLRPPYRWDDCGWLANRWCELLPLDPAAKHRLMALDNPVLRLELVGDALGRMGFPAAA